MPLKTLIALGGDSPRGAKILGGRFGRATAGRGFSGDEMLMEVNGRRVLRRGMIKKVKCMNFLARKLCYKT
jgi:hypothetical protein